MKIRKYNISDEEKLCSLYVEQYGKYNGFDQCTTKQWYARYILNKNIGEDNVLVAFDDSIVGYCAFGKHSNFISLPDKTGIIFDLCVRNGIKQIDYGIALIEECYNQLKKSGVDNLSATFCQKDKYIKKVLDLCGFTSEKKYLTAGIVPSDYEIFFEKRISSCHWFTLNYNLNIHLSQNFSEKLISFGNNGILSILINSGTNKKNINIYSGLTDFMDLISGESDLFNKVITNKIKVYPLYNIPIVNRLLGDISFNGNWFIPTIDWR